jgi:hypothetical protein
MLAVAIAKKLDSSQKQGEKASRKAAHGQHEREPPEVGVWALTTADAAEACEDEGGSNGSGAEDQEAGAKELASVWLHRVRDFGLRTMALG